jgi:hypothetical protein
VRREPDGAPPPAKPDRANASAPTERKAPVLGEDDQLLLPESGDLRGLLEELGHSEDDHGK